MIIVDSREPEKWREIGDVVENIQVDFIVTGKFGRFAIERKTLKDLLNSIFERGRFWKQLERLKELQEQGYVPIVLVHGNLYRQFKSKYRRLTMPQWVGIKIAIMRMGIHVYYALNDREAEMFIKRLNERIGEEKEWERPSIAKKKNRTLDDVCFDVLMAFDGIGFKTAKKLFRKYGKLKRIFNECNNEKIKEVLEYEIREEVEDS